MLEILIKYSSYFITGLKSTLGLSIISVLIGIVIGSLLALMKLSKHKPLKWIAAVYIEVVRGTPMITQLFIVYFGSYVLFGLDMNPFIAGIIAVSLNSGAYVAEIIRSGIQSIDKGQMEAGRSLGMTQSMTMKEIIMPQAVKNILPALCNEFITVIKETSIVSVIGVTDLMYNVNIVRGISFRPLEPLLIAAVIYFILTFGLSKAVNILEGKMKQSD
ncbi:MAG: amino acid ABC transporter permease [Proteocatella sp.]|nr:amino acid ABC transporter permease [Proteocatella sp.]NCB70631.1 amino acid ABC transporter permease [Clostridia bacterium]MBP7907650.1 amino acid ABC transporter permease [Proteocatella sp.]MBP8653701.1 amino acid ABC transporter permease [Proteocatella sp.]MBP9658281.1 amino acid ABC transporter permease [Proteocatella sp.]